MIKSLVTFLMINIVTTVPVSGQSPEEITNAFQSSGALYNVPIDILKSIAYTETRFSHVIPDDSHEACSGMPHSYGIMGLKDDDWFGHSLLEAANLIGATPEMLIYNYELNIRGAAALLSDLAAEMNINRKKT